MSGFETETQKKSLSKHIQINLWTYPHGAQDSNSHYSTRWLYRHSI